MSDPKGLNVTIPEHVYRRVEGRVPRSDFDSVDRYVTFVLEEVLVELEEEAAAEHDTVDETEVKDRLESLGYIDQ